MILENMQDLRLKWIHLLINKLCRLVLYLTMIHNTLFYFTRTLPLNMMKGYRSLQRFKFFQYKIKQLLSWSN